MRAYLSTGRCRCYRCYPAILEDGALNEAERIVADVEGSSHMMNPHATLAQLSHNHKAALAEGLAGAITAMQVTIAVQDNPWDMGDDAEEGMY